MWLVSREADLLRFGYFQHVLVLIADMALHNKVLF